MLSIESTASMLNPYIVYGALGLYGLAITALLLYVHAKFKGARLLLRSLQEDWSTADNRHKNILTEAKDHVSKLVPQVQQPMMTAAPVAARAAVTFDTRNQVVTMGRKGFTPTDIARSCGLPEGDVDVLLGLARIQR